MPTTKPIPRVTQAQVGTSKIRNRAIQGGLVKLLTSIGESEDVYFLVTSGGQTSDHSPKLKDKPGGWTGSRRHDDGGAADTQVFILMPDGTRKFLDFDTVDGRARWRRIIQLAVAGGAMGVGAGAGYMGTKTAHIGYGSPLTWGAGGKAANAPQWLREAFAAGLALIKPPKSKKP